MIPLNIRRNFLFIALAIAGIASHSAFAMAAAAITGADRIRVGSVHPHPGFINSSLRAFIPRGVNYTRLDRDYHVTFDPDFYSASVSETALKAISASGYNFVRVFVSTIHSNRGFGLSGPGVGDAFASNLVDFMMRARAHHLYVSLAGENVPENYRSMTNSRPALPHVSGDTNAKILNPGAILSCGRFWQDLLRKLDAMSPGILSSIFTIDINNEMFVDLAEEPFSLKSGQFIDSGGAIYDLANDSDRQLLIDNNSVKWLNSVRDAIRGVDSQLLVGTSVFTPAIVGRSFLGGTRIEQSPDRRMPLRLQALASNSAADYLDLHVYPQGITWSVDTDLTSAELSTSQNLVKPLLMGEFGMAKAVADLQSSADQLLSMQQSSCRYGFVGWGYWTWDTSEQTNFWNLLDAGSFLNTRLAPVGTPHLCSE